MGAIERERHRARVFGFSALLGWATLGVCLEAAHAFKLAAYFDHPLRRELLIWAHAHGVGLALVVLAYAGVGVVDEAGARHGPTLRASALIIPLGFALGVLGHSEGDPGPAIWLVPLGAMTLVVALLGIVRALWRAA